MMNSSRSLASSIVRYASEANALRQETITTSAVVINRTHGLTNHPR